ncbi:hypothetical protein ACHHYP_16415, partial [Achlya hypogyna]
MQSFFCLRATTCPRNGPEQGLEPDCTTKNSLVVVVSYIPTTNMSSKGAAKVFRKDSAAPPTPKVAPAAASEASPTEHKVPGITTQESADDASMGVGEYEASVTDMTMNDLQEAFSRFVLDQPDIMRAAAAAPAPVLPPPANNHFHHIDPAAYQRVAEEKNSHFERPFHPTEDVKQLVSFDQIKAPTLHKPDLAEMKAFWLKYDKYERDLREKYEQYGQQFAIQYRHVRNCMEPYVFNTICRYRWKRDPAEITHANVYALFKIDCAGSHAEIPAFLERLKRELRIDETISDGAFRILCLITLYEKICTESGFPGYCESETKNARHHVIQALKPDAVRQLIEKELQFSEK